MRGPAALVARPETADMDDQASNGSTTDRDLVERAAAGDAAAFSELYERHFENLYDFAARTVRDRDLAADALQGAFIKAWKRLPSGDAVEHPQPWLYALVRAEAMGAARDETGTSPAGSGPGEADPGLFAATDTASDTGAAEPPPDAALAALAWQAASALDADDYLLLDLSLRRGLDGRAIARALELEESDVYARLTRLGSSFEGAATSLALAVRGREACPELDGLVVARKDGSRVELDRPANRRIRAHLKTCLTCQETRRLLLAPTESFAALAPVAAMPGVREAVWSGLDVQAEAATSGDSASASRRSKRSAKRRRRRPRPRRPGAWMRRSAGSGARAARRSRRRRRRRSPSTAISGCSRRVDRPSRNAVEATRQLAAFD